MKSQAGLETLFGVSLLVILLIFAFTFSLSKSSETRFANAYLEARKICDELRTTVNQVYANGFGFAASFNIPNKLALADYNLTIYATNKTITLEWDGNLFSCTLFTPSVTNGTISKGLKTFKNVNGVVLIV